MGKKAKGLEVQEQDLGTQSKSPSCKHKKMCQSAKDTETTSYNGIGFQGKTGSLLLAAEKLVFHQDSDSSSFTRAWLWPSIKKSQITPAKHVITIFNFSNKAVSFHVPANNVEDLNNDINARMASAQKLKKNTEANTSERGPMNTRQKVQRSVSTDESLYRALKLAQVAKTAHNTAKSQEKPALATTDVQIEDPKPRSKPTKTKMKVKRTKSAGGAWIKTTETTRNGGGYGSALSTTASSSTDSPSEDLTPRAKPAKMRMKVKRSKSTGDAWTNKTVQATRQEEGPMRSSWAEAKSSDENASQGSSTSNKASTINSIGNPANRNTSDSAQDKDLKPTQEKLVKMPVIEKIVRPTQQAAHKLLLPPKIIAQDMGLLPSRSGHGSKDRELGGSAHCPTKRPFLHFLKAPPRRTLSDEFSTEDFASPSDDEADKVEEIIAERQTTRKSAGAKFLSSIKSPMKLGPPQRSNSRDVFQ